MPTLCSFQLCPELAREKITTLRNKVDYKVIPCQVKKYCSALCALKLLIRLSIRLYLWFLNTILNDLCCQDICVVCKIWDLSLNSI